jgi:hypothetical protein
MTPLETSLGGSSATVVGPVLADGCREMHAFFSSMFDRMYEQPELFGLPVYELERFTGGKKINALKQKYPKEADLIKSKTINSVTVYPYFLLRLFRSGEIKDGIYRIGRSEYDMLLSDFDRKRSSKKTETRLNFIAYDIRLSAFLALGLKIEETENGATVSYRHPNMLPAIRAMVLASQTVKTFGEESFRYCEFRILFGKFKPTYSDVVAPLDDAHRLLCDLAHTYLLSIKATPSSTTFWKVNYKYKGSQLAQISTEGSEMRLTITGTYHWDSPALINDRLAKMDDTTQKFALQNLKYCIACSASHGLGAFFTILGQRKRLCSGIHFLIRHRCTAEDIPQIKKLLMIRIGIIDNQS